MTFPLRWFEAFQLRKAALSRLFLLCACSVVLVALFRSAFFPEIPPLQPFASAFLRAIRLSVQTSFFRFSHCTPCAFSFAFSHSCFSFKNLIPCGPAPTTDSLLRRSNHPPVQNGPFPPFPLRACSVVLARFPFSVFSRNPAPCSLSLLLSAAPYVTPNQPFRLSPVRLGRFSFAFSFQNLTSAPLCFQPLVRASRPPTHANQPPFRLPGCTPCSFFF